MHLGHTECVCRTITRRPLQYMAVFSPSTGQPQWAAAKAMPIAGDRRFAVETERGAGRRHGRPIRQEGSQGRRDSKAGWLCYVDRSAAMRM